MNQNEKRKEVQRLPISSEEEALMEEIIGRAFEADPEEALLLVKDFMQTQGSQAPNTAWESLPIVLQSLSDFFEALRLMGPERNFAEACNRFQKATLGFDQVEKKELTNLSKDLCSYTKSLIELQRLNIDQSLGGLEKVKRHLERTEEFSSRIKYFIENREIGEFFSAATKAIETFDFATAKILIERASQASNHMACKYYQEGESDYYSYQGFSYFCKAYYKYIRTQIKFDQFNYDELAAEQNLARYATKAHKLFERAGDRNWSNICRAIAQLSESVVELSKLMQKVCHSTFKPDFKAFMILKQRINTANSLISEIGMGEAVPLVRFCDQLSIGLNNLERHLKPSKKDFGKFSGIVTAALFLPLFLTVAWANSAFNIGLGGSELVMSCLTLALITGFGYGALKFKSLIFHIPGEGK